MQPITHSPVWGRQAWLFLCLVGVVGAGSACFLDDLFADAGARAVTFQWTGDTVVAVGVPTFFQVTVAVDGVPAATYPVELEIPDTTNLKFGVTHDTVIGLRPGHGDDVVARIRSSLSPAIDSAFNIRVRP